MGDLGSENLKIMPDTFCRRKELGYFGQMYSIAIFTMVDCYYTRKHVGKYNVLIWDGGLNIH